MILQLRKTKKRQLNVAILTSIVSSIMISANPVLASDYGTTSLGGGINLSWQQQGVLGGARTGGEPIQVGYACLTLDRLNTNNNDAAIHRYAIMITPGSDDLSLKPINAVTVRFDSRDSRTLTAHPVEVIPEQLIWKNAQLDSSGDWFENNTAADGLGQACIDGGITKALDYLQQVHGFAINR